MSQHMFGDVDRESARRTLRIGAAGGVVRLAFTGLSGVVVLSVVLSVVAGMWKRVLKTVAQNVTNHDSLCEMAEGNLCSPRSPHSECDGE